MSQTTVTVPDSLVQAWKFFDRNHVAIIGVLVVALISSIVVELFKRKYNAKQLKQAEGEAVQLSKRGVAWLLTVITTLFTALGYAIFLVQSNKSYVSQLPYIGQGVTEALGVAYLLYNLRLNKSYQTFANWASKWSKSKPTDTDLQQPPVEPPVAQGDVLV